MKNKLLITVASVTLVACASNNQHQDSTVQRKAVANTKAKAKVPGLPPIKIDTLTVRNSGVHLAKGNDINAFTLNGNKINLVTIGKNKPGMFELFEGAGAGDDVVTRTVSGTNYSNVKFGVIHTTKDKVVHLVQQGFVTAVNEIPTNGSVNYIGEYVDFTKDYANSMLSVMPTSSGALTAAVNFGTKKIEVVTSHLGPIKGNLSGNTFTFNDDKGKGAFYGANASELGGVYEDDRHAMSFGAVKQ